MSNRYPAEKTAFYEVQRFRQAWIWIIVLSIAALMWYAFIRQVVFGEPFGTNPAPDWMIFLFLAFFGLIFPAFLLVMRLEIRVSGNMLAFRMYPLHPHWKLYPAADIAGVMAVIYRPFREYGGWGIRFGRQGIAYTVSGDTGVLVRLASGRSFLLGSRRSLELEAALKDMTGD